MIHYTPEKISMQVFYEFYFIVTYIFSAFGENSDENNYDLEVFMKFSIKKAAILLAVLMIMPVTAAARSDSAIVSPAIAVIASEATVKVNGSCGGNAVFSASDFDLTLGKKVDSITVLTLPDPAKGTLLLGEKPVEVNQTIKRRHLSSLVFTPADKSETEASFCFTSDGAYSVTCEICIVKEINASPKISADIVNVAALSGISTAVSISAHDPDGDDISYFITDFPDKGSATVSSDGTIVYTPSAKKRGRDSFTVYARDEYGNWSEPAEVSIKIGKNKTGIEYSDLEGLAIYSDAVKLSASGIMSGESKNGKMYFEPNKSVTREEFITMLMKTIGLSEISDISDVGFADDASISEDARKYCRAAKKLGIVNGSSVDGRLYFNPKSEITQAEAAVMLNNLIGVEEAVGQSAVSVFAEDSVVPAWAKNAVGAMHAIGVMKITDGGASALSALTRGDAAKLLSVIMDMVVE